MLPLLVVAGELLLGFEAGTKFVVGIETVGPVVDFCTTVTCFIVVLDLVGNETEPAANALGFSNGVDGVVFSSAGDFAEIWLRSTSGVFGGSSNVIRGVSS